MPKTPSTTVLLNKRVASALNTQETGVDWSPSLVQTFIAELGECILNALSNGEDVQLGRLGRFTPRVLGPRKLKTPLVEGEVTVPRKIKVSFEPSPFSDKRMRALFEMASGE